MKAALTANLHTILVLVAFALTVTAYTVLSLNGSGTGVLENLLLIEGGAVAGVAGTTSATARVFTTPAAAPPA